MIEVSEIVRLPQSNFQITLSICWSYHAIFFNYLKSLLKGTASLTIAGLQLSAENYDTAVKLLEERFGNKQIIISGHISGQFVENNIIERFE
jgi:hypothetical protein